MQRRLYAARVLCCEDFTLRGLYAEDPAETAPGKNICYNEKRLPEDWFRKSFFMKSGVRR